MPITVEQCENDYLSFSDFRSAMSVERARKFAIACRGLLLLRATRSARGAVGGVNSLEFSISQIKADLDSVETWLLMQNVPIGPIYADLGGIRS